MIKFHMFAASATGPKYAEKGWDCQDASDTLDFENVQAIAVADGHGGSDYFRSAIGSKLAIKVLFEQIKLFCKDLHETERLSDTGIKKLKYDFVKEWRQAVKKDWDDKLADGKPLGEGEIRYESVSEKYKARYTSSNPKIVDTYLYVAYGTTLICAVSIGAQILVLQIGDGTCVLLQRNGEFRLPITPDSDNFLNVTVSLCDNDAELKIRHAILDCDSDSLNSPAAIFLSTDGLDDCFPYYKNETHLYKFYADVLIDNLISRGFFFTEMEIKGQLLAGLSKKSSQDDISLAYFTLSNSHALKEVFEKIEARYKSTPALPAKTSNAVTATPKPAPISNTVTTPSKPTPISNTVTATPPAEQPLTILPSAFEAVTHQQQSIPPISPQPQAQTIHRSGNVSYGAPVQVGGTPTTEGGKTT